MDEPVNPYESPQADLGQPFAEGIPDDLPGLRTTGIGLSLVYYGIIIILLAILGSLCGAFLLPLISRSAGSLPGFAFFALLIGVPVLVGSLLMFAGQIVCLFVPSQTGAKGYIISTVVLQIASIVQNVLPIVQQYVPRAVLPQPVAILLNSLGLISIILFVLFMRRLSISLGHRNLVNKARNILIFGSILFVVFVVMLVGSLILKNELFAILGIVLLIGGLICFVMYANLVNALRKVLLSKAPRSI